MAVVPLSRAELDFTLQALRRENVRVDGRALSAYRRLGIRFGAAHGEVEVSFGPTRALAVCTGEVITPPPERPNEGRLSFHVEFGPIASPSFEVHRPSVQAVTVSNFVERLLKGSRAIDAEALCIVGGQKVWSVRVDIRALDDDGNLPDVCAVAALCSLMHFRKAEVAVVGETAQVFTAEERVPVPLSIHHLPVPVSFALFVESGCSTGSGKAREEQPTWILDPNRLEEAAMSGSLCVALNQHGELCGLHKPGGLAVDFALIQHCIEVATARVKEICTRINSELEADLAKRKEARRNVHARYPKEKLLSVELSVTESRNEAPARAPLLPKHSRPEQPAAAQSAQESWKVAAAKAAAKAVARKVLVALEPVAPPVPLPITSSAEAAAALQAAQAAEAEAAAAEEAAAAAVASADPYGDADIAAELEAVEAEAAELEAQLLAAAAEAGRSEEAASSTVASSLPVPVRKKKKPRVSK